MNDLLLEPINSQVSNNGALLTIFAPKRFTFNYLDHFRQSYESVSPLPKSVYIDFSNTNAVDPTAVGMLLLMRHYFGDNCSDIAMLHCTDEIKSEFLRRSLDTVFTVQ